MPHEAQARCSTINEWYDHFRESALTVPAESLTRFGAIVHGALYSFLQKPDELMLRTAEKADTLIRAMNAKFVVADADLRAPSWTGPAPGIA